MTTLTTLLVMALGLYVLRRFATRLALSRAKHPSLRGHSRWSRRIARLMPYFEYRGEVFFRSDLAPAEVGAQRWHALERLRRRLAGQSPATLAVSEGLEEDISDVRFTSHYRVPFPYRAALPREFRLGGLVSETRGAQLRDLDGTWRYDVFGSYGVNVFGSDFYKECLQAGFRRAEAVGLVLGPYHPAIREVVGALKAISGLDEVSFHMSGTEAVMQAVRLARYHTGRSHLVRLCGAYHGWWDGVQPGVGNTRRADDVYTLADLSARTLDVLETRDDIACVLVNPLQALHPNADAPGDSSLVASDRHARLSWEDYSAWLRQLREVCTRRGIVLIFDEVFTGFRLAYRGAQEYFGVQADLVTYGKTLGGGLPVGVVCGRHGLMKRFRDDRPADVSFARGTFNSHPYVVACMAEFLARIAQPAIQEIYAQAETTWRNRIDGLNRALADAAVPVRLANLQSIVTVLYTRASRYNWMLQFYLRAEGLELAWIGTGRLIFSLDYSDAEFAEVAERFLRAARQMLADGWWWTAPHLTNRWIKRRMLKDMLAHRFGQRGAAPRPATGMGPAGGIAQTSQPAAGDAS